MGGIVDSVTGLFGVEGGESVNPLGFNPGFTQSPLGTADFGPSNIALGLSPELQQAYGGLLSSSAARLGQSRDLPGTLDFLRQTTSPEFDRQRLSQESRLFNQGLLGSTTGQLQQQGLSEAQNQTLLQNALQTQAQQTQQAQGLLGNALQVAQQPLNLAELSLQRAGGQLQADEGTAGLRQRADENQANFFSSLVQAGATAAASDIRLKENVTPIGGGWYTWQWNEEAKRIGADQYPTVGVIAQDLLKDNPNAVFKGDHGYLMVDYSKVV